MSDATPQEADAPETTSVQPATMHGVPLSDSCGQRVLHPTREQYLKLVRTLLDESFTMCADLTAADYLTYPNRALPDGIVAERFEVVVNLLSIEQRHRIRIRVQVPVGDACIPTLFDMYPGAEAMEREVFDMFGIEFTDHPDLTRILMPEDWEGFPLRKDYDQGSIPVQFSTDFAARETTP